MSGEAKLARIETLLEVLAERVKEVDDLYTELQAVCNHTPRELLTLFKEGYTLTPPTIDPSSLVKRGRWKKGTHCLECSTCRGGYLGMPATKYCPDCGALMED